MLKNVKCKIGVQIGSCSDYADFFTQKNLWYLPIFNMQELYMYKKPTAIGYSKNSSYFDFSIKVSTIQSFANPGNNTNSLTLVISIH